MFRFVSSFVLLLLCTTAARAFEFGAPVPLTNSLYGTLAGEVRLASNGEDVFAFWASHGTIRAKVYYENESRVSRSVMTTTATSIDDFDVLWTGTQFLVVATHDHEIRARLLDRDAFTYGGEFAVGGLGTMPRLAFNGRSALLAHRDQGTRAVLVTPLSARGEVLAPATRIEGANPADFAIASNGDGFALLTTRVDCTFFDNTGRKQSTTTLAPDAARRVTIASDGARYFAAWFTTAKSSAATIEASGGAGRTLTFDEMNRGVNRAPASVWTGSDYVVAYATDQPGHTLRVQHFNRDAALTSTEPERFFDQSVGGVALLAHRGTTWLAWNPTSHGVVERLPLQHVTLAGTPYGQAEQTLLAAATSATQTLILWKENVDARSVVRSGVRSMVGSWREESVTLARDVERGVAGSNANGFVAVVSDEISGTAVRFNQAGVPLAPTIEVPFAVTGIVASGNGYVLAGLDLHSAIVVARLDASGVLSTPVNVPMSGLLTSVAIATNGTEFLLAWSSRCLDFCPLATQTYVIRLDPKLVALDREPLRIATHGGIRSTSPVVVWNGNEYAVVWEDGDLFFTTVGLDGAMQTTQFVEANAPIGDLRAADLHDGSMAILWAEGDVHRVAIAGAFGVISQTATIFDDTPTRARFETDIVRLPNGRIGYLASPPWVPPPHQGSPRVTLRVADRILSVAPRPPVAPISTVRYFSNGTNYDAVLTLPEHPPGVIGYRVEYRRNTPYASWNEWSTWFSTIDTRLRLYGLSAPTTQLRLRAITDFGISVPVNALPPSPSNTKRRAVQ